MAVDRARSAGAIFSSALLDALSGNWTRAATARAPQDPA
jgi:hypothetical protein